MPARPFFIGSDGWVRSSAWTEDFSSMHSTIACSGGFRYNPTTSISFSSNVGSLLSLNVLTRCGLSPRADQTRCTVAFDTPTSFAIVRVLQCVPPFGLQLRVRSTISSILSCGISGGRPRPGATLPNFVNPCSANRFRHARTVTGVTPVSVAIWAFATPSAASSRTRARCTSRCAAVCEAANRSRISRWLSDMANAAAGFDLPLL